ncbi:MAG: restriction endonuclease subunit S [Lentisphaerae bacterium]|nr:restriction endonuclease subunit S [Lentisphaerota bacterium]
MNEWKTISLGEVAELNPRLTEKLPEDEEVSFIPMSAVSAETKTITCEETRNYASVAKGYTPFIFGDVLIAKITPCFENGKIAQASLSHHIGFGSTEFHVIRPKKGKLDGRYVLHFLRQEHIRIMGERRMTGSAGQRRVPENFLFHLEISIPPLPEQKRIAEVLDKADELRAKRRAAIEKLDSLTQSIFLEMFGDPSTNPKGWKIHKIRDLLESASYGTSEKSGATGEFPVLRMNNISRTGAMDFGDLKFMELDAKYKERYLVKKGDVLFNRTNSPELVGKTAIFRDTKPMAYAGYLIRLRVNDENNPE